MASNELTTIDELKEDNKDEVEDSECECEDSEYEGGSYFECGMETCCTHLMYHWPILTADRAGGKAFAHPLPLLLRGQHAWEAAEVVRELAQPPRAGVKIPHVLYHPEPPAAPSIASAIVLGAHALMGV
jgi:hypothetical protein